MELERYSIDVKTAMDDLYIGPQANVLETIARFNNEWVRNPNDNLGITPKFRWKPGTYDKVKNVLSQRWLQWDKRPSGMESLFSRERTYSKNRVKEALLSLDRLLYDLRDSGQTFITDTDEIEGHFNLFKTTLEMQLEKLREVFPDSQVYIHEGDNFASTTVQTKICIPDLKINVSVGDRNGQNRELGVINFGGLTFSLTFPLSIWFNTLYPYLNLEQNQLIHNDIRIQSKLLTTHHRYRYNGSFRGFVANGELHTNTMGNDHPYVSRGGYGTGNVCMGDMMGDILGSYLKLDWTTFGYFIDMWLTTYKCGVTGPLNTIDRATSGKIKIYDLNGVEKTDDYYDVVGHSSGQNCFNKTFHYLERIDDTNVNSRVIESCDAKECLLRDSCRPYINNTIGLEMRDAFRTFVTELEVKTLLPNEQEEDRLGHRFIDLISDITYCTEQFGDIRTPHGLLENAFVNKESEKAIQILQYCLDKQITKVCEDDSYNVLLLDAILKCKSHKELVDLVNEQYSQRHANELEHTDEQEEMAAWAHAMNQQ